MFPLHNVRFKAIFIVHLFVHNSLATCGAFVTYHNKAVNSPRHSRRISRERRRVVNKFCSQHNNLCHLFSSWSDEEGEASSKNEDTRNDFDAMRRMLEASWNTKDMGRVPSTPESAAQAAAESIKDAQSNRRNIMLIDLLLPAYDITQGELYYDEILAAKYCTYLASSLQKPTCIFVRDGKGKRLIDRVLETNSNNEESAQSVTEDSEGTDTEEEENNDFVEYDDFSDLAQTSSTFVVDDADLFRSQLESSWDDNETLTNKEQLTVGSSPETNKEQSSVVDDISYTEKGKNVSKDNQPSLVVEPASFHEFGSLLGDVSIKIGSPDMFQQIEQTISSNAIPLIERNEAIIILSAYSDEEMIAVRRIVATYETKKPIILVNCKLNPMPRELLSAETVYSLLPLMARPVDPKDDNNLFQGSEQKTPPPSPKIVVLRRYPRDWDIFVDEDGSSGFELVTSVPVSSFMGGRQKGPSMEFIAGVVKQHMQFKDSSSSS